MNGDQLLLTIAYGVLVLVSAIIFAFVVRSTRASRVAAEPDERRLAAGENRWGVVVVVMLVVLLGLTLISLPYGNSKAKSGAQLVRVQAQQFGWSIRPAVVKAGKPVEFHLSSKDVQHGFGVFRGHELVLQVQVPAHGGGEQRYVFTFDKPGTYDVLCMEFCGFQHHTMRGSIRVT